MAFGYDSSINGLLAGFLDFTEGQVDEFDVFSRCWISDHGAEPPSLMDLIGGWVAYGNATRTCGSYEVFLVAVIAITELWATGSLPGWKGQGNSRQPITAYSQTDPSRTGPHHVIMHDALNRTLWEITSADNRDRDRRDLVENSKELRSK